MKTLTTTALVFILPGLTPGTSWSAQLPPRFATDTRATLFTQISSEAYNKTLNMRLPGRSGTNTPYQSISDYSAVLPKNLRIKFTMKTISNQIVSGGGINANVEPPINQGAWVTFDNYSESADIEISDSTIQPPLGNYSVPLPAAGETFQIDTDYFFIYDGLIFDGCENVPYVPINFTSMVRDFDNEGELLGQFSAYDNTTLVPNGYWSFDYGIRAMDSNGAVSDFGFQGVVEVLCSNIENYD